MLYQKWYIYNLTSSINKLSVKEIMWIVFFCTETYLKEPMNKLTLSSGKVRYYNPVSEMAHMLFCKILNKENLLLYLHFYNNNIYPGTVINSQTTNKILGYWKGSWKNPWY